MYKIETNDECGLVVDEYERHDLEEVRELIVELIKDSRATADQIVVYQKINFSCSVSVEFTD